MWGKINLIFVLIFSTCPEIDDETLAAKIEQLEAPRRQFREANKHLQDKVPTSY